MIHESLKFLGEEVNKYLNLKIPNPTPSVARLVVSNVSLSSDATADILLSQTAGKLYSE